VTLCPTCHRLLHAIGRALLLEQLPVQVLREAELSFGSRLSGTG
jgi:hypothetical protein